MIYLGADHAGYQLKETIKKYFDTRSMGYVDLGAGEYIKDDDYPEYAARVARAVAREKGARGVLVCGTGNGMAIAANKIKGIRAMVGWDSTTAKKGVEDDHANVIALPSRRISHSLAVRIVAAFLNARPSRAARHVRRVERIASL